MILLLAVAFVGGVLTAVSPCVLPVLPVVLLGGAAEQSRWRPYAIVGGLVLTFTVTLLAGEALLSALGLPQDLLQKIGVVMLLVLALGLLVPAVGRWIERPFSRLGGYEPRADAGGLVLGMGLGLAFVPCAGPVLSAITTAAQREYFSFRLVVVALCYAAGLAVPLLAFALLGSRAGALRVFRRHAQGVRMASGAVIAVLALVMLFSWTNALTTVPGPSSLENGIEGSAGLGSQLRAIDHEKPNKFAENAQMLSSLPDLGPAPNFTGITAWLNTAGNRPLSLAELRGKVVLVDFWTYSCINCQRTLPHVEAWYREYHRYGFVVVGVHSPEFPFEHVVSNVEAAAARLGVDYPIAVDDNLATWYAYDNEYWPAEYLIDQHGDVRHTDFGEGDYATTEMDIRDLLTAGGAHTLPPPTDVPDRTPNEPTTQESYLGYERIDNDEGTAVQPDKAQDYRLGTSLPPNTLSFGGTWTVHQWDAVAGAAAQLDLQFEAEHVYLVLGGTGTVTVAVNGHVVDAVQVTGIPDLYQLVSYPTDTSGLLSLSMTPGVQAYDFTFG